MPVTKTAKRALRSSSQKFEVNNLIKKNLGIAIRMAKKTKSLKDVLKVYSLADRAAKKNVFHKNKASRIKSAASKIVKPKASSPSVPKKTSKKTK